MSQAMSTQDEVLQKINLLDSSDPAIVYRELTDLELFLILHPGNTLYFYEQLHAEMMKLLQQHVIIIAQRGVLKNLTIASRIMRSIEQSIAQIEEASQTIQGEE